MKSWRLTVKELRLRRSKVTKIWVQIHRIALTMVVDTQSTVIFYGQENNEKDNDILLPVLAAALDRTKISDRNGTWTSST